MPIRINLLAEALAEEDLRRRDPVKRSIYIGVFLVVLSLVWFSSKWLEYIIAKKTLSSLQSEISTRTNEFSQVKLNIKRIDDGQKRLDALDKLSSARFLQGNFLNALQQIYVPNVVLTRLRLDQSYTLKEGTASKTNGFGNVMAGQAGTSTERVVLTIDAKDFSPNPGDQVNRFKDGFFKQPYFKTNLETNGIRLASAPAAPQAGSDAKYFVLFSLECRFPDKQR
jgi:hypothetical protein